MYQFVDGKDKHVFGRFTTGTLVNPKEHASFIIMDGGWWVVGEVKIKVAGNL
jgi:hypothetical protein